MAAVGGAQARPASRQQHSGTAASSSSHHADDAKASPFSSASRTRPRKQHGSQQRGAAASGPTPAEESEERRVKLLTESVLYDLLPAALHIMLPQADVPVQEPDMDKCRAVASAAMCVSCLLNAPPGFLEFLLCVPWRKLSQLYPRSESIDKLISNLHVTEDERRRLVNTRIEPALTSVMLDFLYRADHVEGLPPMLQLTKGAQAAPPPAAASSPPTGPSPATAAAPQAPAPAPTAAGPNGAPPAAGPAAAAPAAAAGPSPIVLETVAALLDGATPLHCAALRGNPAQVDHLLACGADPSLRTTAGELPLEMVPVCSDYDSESGQRVCRCMGPLDQEVWECRSTLARSLVTRQSLFFFRAGLFTWLHMVLLAILCWFGYWGWHTSITRPSIEHHVVSCRERKRQEARSRAQGLMSRMRSEAQQGHLQLGVAKQEFIHASGRPPDSAEPGCLQADNGTVVDPAAPQTAAGAAAGAGPSKARTSAAASGRKGGAGAGGPAEGAGAQAQAQAHSCSSSVSSSSSSSERNSGTVGAAAAAAREGVGPHVLAGGAEAAASEIGPAAAAGTGAAAGTSSGSTSSGNSTTLCRCSVALVAAGKLKEANLQEGSGCYGGEGSACESAFRSFVVAVHSLQGLDLQGDTVPRVLTDTVDVADESYQTHVLEDEQADLYCSWSESVLLKYRSCSCPSCTTLTVQAVRMAHLQCNRLFTRVEKLRATMPGRWHSVGQSLARAIYTHICLLLATDVRQSPTKLSLWRSEQCLREWAKLVGQGLAPGPGEWVGPAPSTGSRGEAWVGVDLAKVEELQQWTRAADSDLYLGEALLGSSLATGQSLAEALALAVTQLPTGEMYLTRTVTPEVLQQIDQAITLACSPSPHVGQLARNVARCSGEEMTASLRLRDAMNGRGLPAKMLDAAALLASAIEAAASFPRLVGDVEAARELHDRWLRRSEAVDRLDGIVETVRQYTLACPLSMLTRDRDRDSPNQPPGASTPSGSSRAGGVKPPAADAAAGAGAAAAAAGGLAGRSSWTVGSCSSSGAVGTSDLLEWEQQLVILEAAINEAKAANIGVSKAKRLLKEMQAQSAVAEAARQLEAVMSKRPAGSGALRGALVKAEEAAAALSSAGGAPVLNEVLLPLVQSGRRRLEMERAAEALHKAAATCKTLADLPRLEAAILTARKLGAEELDGDSYRTASDMLGRLHEAARCRTALDAAVRALGRGLRGNEDAEAVERALGDAAKWGKDGLLGSDIAKARESLEQWKSQTASEARLARALTEGSTTQALARAIQEAAAAGVKVQSARRTLKLMQAVEAAMVPGPEGAPAQAAVLRTRVEAAEQAGVVSPLLAAARRLLWHLAASGAREALEAALRPHTDWPPAQRLVALRSALGHVEAVMGAPLSASALGLKGEHASTELGDEANDSGSDDAKATADVGASPDGDAAPAAAAAAAMPPMSPEDEADLAALLELAGRAWLLVEEDQREVARLDAEKVAAERARKEQVEREKQERLKLEQARQQKERAEILERERAAAEKRDKAKADKVKSSLVLAKSLGGSKSTLAAAAAAAVPIAAAKGAVGSPSATAALKAQGVAGAKPAAPGGSGSDAAAAKTGRRASYLPQQPGAAVNGWQTYGPMPPPPPPPRLASANASAAASTTCSDPSTPVTPPIGSSNGDGSHPTLALTPPSHDLPASRQLPPMAAGPWNMLGLSLPDAAALHQLGLLQHRNVSAASPQPSTVAAHGRMDSTESLGESALAALDSDMLLALELGGAGAGLGARSGVGGRPVSPVQLQVPPVALVPSSSRQQQQQQQQATTPGSGSPRRPPPGLPPVLVEGGGSNTAVPDSFPALSPSVPSQVQAAWGTLAPAPPQMAQAGAGGAEAGPMSSPSAVPSQVQAAWGSVGSGSAGAGGDVWGGALGACLPASVASAGDGAGSSAGGAWAPRAGGGLAAETASQHTQSSSHFSSATSADELLLGVGAASVAPTSTSRQSSIPRTLARPPSPLQVPLPPSAPAPAPEALATAVAAATKPKIDFVDLGGASWGLEPPLTSSTGGGASGTGLLLLPTALQELSGAWQQFPIPMGPGAASSNSGPAQPSLPLLWGAPAPDSAAAASSSPHWQQVDLGPGPASRQLPEDSKCDPVQSGTSAMQMLLGPGGLVATHPHLFAAVTRDGGSGSAASGTNAGAAASGAQGSPSALASIKPLDWPASELLAMAAAAAAAARSASSAASTPRQLPHPSLYPKPCRYYLSGYCRDGDRCRFLHPTLPMTLPGGIDLALHLSAGSTSSAQAMPSPLTHQHQQLQQLQLQLQQQQQLQQLQQQQQQQQLQQQQQQQQQLQHQQLQQLQQQLQKNAAAKLAHAMQQQGATASGSSSSHPALPDELSFSPSVSPRMQPPF